MRSTRIRGLTFIELITAVLIMSVMMAAGTAFYQSAMADAQEKQCRSNMQEIANADEQYKLQSSTHTYTTNLSDLSSQIFAMPICPCGGTYTITISDGTLTAQNGQTVPSGWIVVSCSLSGHGKFAPGIDTN